MICPKCQVARLIKRRAKGKNFSVEYCLKCKGVWFDRDELEALMPEAVREMKLPRHAQKDPECLCPKCNKTLYAFDYPETYVVINMCIRCGGIWLDRGEFKKIREVRRSLKQEVEMQEHTNVTGIKGALICFIDSAIGNLPTSIGNLMR